MTDRIYLSPPDVGPAEEQAVLRALRSGWVAPLGPEVDAFEQEMAEYTERRYAVALSSGTAALHLALLSWGIGTGDHVLTSTMTFAATANAITYTGAEPVFVDCDETGNIDVDLLQHAVTDLQASGKKIGAIIPVDLLGKVANYEAIQEIADRARVPVIADAAESLGARRNGRPAGSFGAAAILSFNGNKVMTTSGGGMLLTDDADIAETARYLATQARQPVVHYQHTDIGYNYRLSNILAAVGRAQLERLDKMIAKRRLHRKGYADLFGRIEGVSIFGGAGVHKERKSDADNFWLTSILIDPAVRWTNMDLISHLARDQIEARPLWKPMHLQPIFRKSLRYTTGQGERYFKTGVSLPSGSNLSPQEFDSIRASINRFLRNWRNA